MRDHSPIRIEECNGNFDRGRDEAVPVDHFIDSQDILFTQLGFKSRAGFISSITAADVLRVHLYKRVGEADRLLILRNVAGVGKIYDSTDMSTAILSISGMIDFSCVIMFNRAYISPHDRTRGKAGEFLYVYQGTGTARKAAGTKPTGFTLGVTASSQAGNCEAGLRLYAVAFETDSGFITRPGPAVFTQFTAPGSKKTNFSSIPLGPAGTTARHLLCTTAIIGGYSGRQEDYELFFIPGGKISDNTSTTLNDTVSFFDADLRDSADYLLTQLEEIPAFLGMCDYESRLAGWTENAQTGVIRVSKKNDVESIDSTSGFITINPGDGGNMTVCIPFRSILYCLKGSRTFAVQSTSNEPVDWPITRVDSGFGSVVYGASVVLDSQGESQDLLLLVDKGGLLAFSGAFGDQPISWKYQDVWNRINKAYLNTVQIIQDPINNMLYINVPLDSETTPSTILVCDYKNGLRADSVRWTKWKIPSKPTSILINTDNTTGEPILIVGSNEGNVYKYDKTATLDFTTTAIQFFARTAYITSSNEGAVCHYAGIRMLVYGSGNLSITVYGLNEGIIINTTDIALDNAIARERIRLFNLVSERCSVKLSGNGANVVCELVAPIKIFGKELWASRG